MYNEEQKRKFIAGYTKSIHTSNVACNIFEALAAYEETYEKDMCTFTVDELQPVTNNVLGLRAASKWMGIIILREYVRWCIANKYPGACDSIMRVDLLGLDKVRVQMVSSPLHLQKYLDKVFDAEDEETIDNIYRCFFWMGYAGLSEEDTLHVGTSNVDMANMTINHNGQGHPIYREALPAFRNAIQLTQFYYKHPNYSKLVIRNRVAGTTLMRGIKANTQLITLRPTLSKRLTDAFENGRVQQKLSFHRIWLSGLFYRMYEMERAGIPVDFSATAIQEMSGKTYSLEGRATLRQKQNRKAKGYMDDYQRWKLAFSI